MTYQRKSKEYETVHKLTEQNFSKIEAPRLGHMDKKTTESYLGSFDQQVKKEFTKKLEAFKMSREELKVD